MLYVGMLKLNSTQLYKISYFSEEISNGIIKLRNFVNTKIVSVSEKYHLHCVSIMQQQHCSLQTEVTAEKQ